MHRQLTSAMAMAGLVLLALPAAGQPGRGAMEAGRASHAAMADGITLDQAVAMAEKRHAARAVRAEEKRRGDRVEYRIRLLGADGRVFQVTVDPQTGEER